MPALQRTGKEITEIYNRQVDTVYRICFSFMKNTADTEDMVQETFLRLLGSGVGFVSEEHEKAWLIKVASNICRDTLRKRKHQSFLSLDDIRNLAVSEDNAQILGLLVSLDEKYRIVIHLHYVEGYQTEEISSMLDISRAAVKKRLQRGREMLREIYEKEVNGDGF